MLKNQTIIFHRIPKTAGQTMRDIITRQYSFHQIFTINGDKHAMLDYFKGFTENKRNRFRCIQGHQALKLIDYVESPFVFTMFRNPVDRVIVLYLYYKTQRKFMGTPLRKLVDKYSLEAFFKEGVDKDWSEFSDGQFDSIANVLDSETFGMTGSGTSMERLKTIIVKHFVFGLTERFDESLLLLSKQLYWKKSVYYTQVNITRIKETYPDWLIETISDRNKKDMELYEFLNEEFDRRISMKGDQYQKSVVRFQKYNRYLGPYYSIKFKVLRLLYNNLVTNK